jgi:hypothetical protein
MKRIKYSNGSSVINRNFYKNVGDIGIQGKGSLDPINLTASAEGTVSKNIKGARFTAGAYKDSKGRSSESFSIEKQLPNRSSVSINKNRQGTNVSLHKNIGNMYGSLSAGSNKGNKQVLLNLTIPLGRR